MLIGSADEKVYNRSQLFGENGPLEMSSHMEALRCRIAGMYLIRQWRKFLT